MPRKPSPRNLKNPLRLLRALFPPEAPMTQIRLAQLTGIAPDHIRNLENSRRPLNQTQLKKIRYAIGAAWDPERKAWVKFGLYGELFNYEWFLTYRTARTAPEYQTNLDTHMLCRRLLELLKGVEPSDYNATFYRIYDALEEIRTELKVGAAKRIFEKTAFKVEYWADQKTRELKSVERSYPLADSEIAQENLLDLTPYGCPLIREVNDLPPPPPPSIDKRSKIRAALNARAQRLKELSDL